MKTIIFSFLTIIISLSVHPVRNFLLCRAKILHSRCIFYFFILLTLVLSNGASAQITFEKTYGGTDEDIGRSVQQTSDNGYIIAGSTESFGAGSTDVYLIKTNSIGDTLWTKTYGGTDADFGYSVQQTNDNGYIIVSGTESFGAGSTDVYLIKTNANGDTLWTKTYGGIDWDESYSIQQTSDNGYIIAGSTVSGPGNVDVYLIKTNENGDTLWTKTYGDTDEDWGYSVQQTLDNGYIIAGYTNSFGAGEMDVYLIKTNANGDTLWTKTYGGIYSEGSFSVQQTTDGGYIIAGYTIFGATPDVYLIKTNESGDTLWTKTYGGTLIDYGNSVQQTSDGGYIISGAAESFGAGNYDAYLIKTNESDDTLWTKTYGGTDEDQGRSVQQTSDGGYIIAGGTESFGAGGLDVYLIKTDVNGNVSGIFNNSFSKKDVINIYPNPNKGVFNLAVNTPDKCNLVIELMNVYGQIVYKNYVKNILKFNDEIDVSELSKGVYYLRLKTENGIRVKKLIIQ